MSDDPWIGYTYPDDLPEGAENRLPQPGQLVWVYDVHLGRILGMLDPLEIWVDLGGGDIDGVVCWCHLIKPPAPVALG